jgi:hypothetical protein
LCESNLNSDRLWPVSMVYFCEHDNVVLGSLLKAGHFFTLLHVHPLLGNVLVNKFPRRQILGKQSVARLRNNKEVGFSVSSVTCQQWIVIT